MLKLYFLPGAVCAQKALITVAFKGAETELISLTREQLVEPEYRALNPKGVVPTLVDEDANIIVESSTIMRFVDETSTGPALQPATPYLRSVMNNWMKAMDEEMFPAVGCFTMATLLRESINALPDQELQQRLDLTAGPAVGALRFDAVRHGIESRAVNGAIQTWKKYLQKMEDDLRAREWLAGENISLGDIALIPAFLRLSDLGLEPWWNSSLPNVSRWWQAIRREGAMRKFMLDFPNPMSADLRVAGQELCQKVLRDNAISITAA